MEKRINLELRGRRPQEVKQLDLSGCKTGGELLGLTGDFELLETLDLSNSLLTSLKTFPKLKNLKKVDLSGNGLSKGLEYLSECTNLNYIIINNNRIKELESLLESLKSLENLTHLELNLGNDLPNFTNSEYRAKVFDMLPNLQYLDQEDIDGNDEDEEEPVHVNGNGVLDEEDDLDDGDDELEDEEVELEDEEESDGDEVTTGLETHTMYQPSSLMNDDEEESEEDDNSEEDEEEEDSEEEERESTRGKRSPTGESTRGKKRKLDEDLDGV